MEDLVTVPGDRGEELLDRAYGVGEHAMAVPPVETNRRGLILAMGIIQIVLGAIFGLMALGVVVAAAMSSRAPMMLAGLIYGIPTGNLLLTGIGSVRIAHWARRATLISAGMWLGLILLVLGGMAIATGLSGFGMGRGEAKIVAAVMVPIFLLWIALPVTLLIVYTRPTVRATFERGRAR